jgi:predicted transcriptional regulator
LEGDEMDSASEELLKTVAIGLKRQLSGLSPEAVSIFLLLATGKENAQTLAAVLGQALEHVNRSLAELTQRRLVEAIDSVIMHTDKGQTIYSSIIDK